MMPRLRRQKSRSMLRILFLATALISGAGCHHHSYYTDIDLADRDALFPDLRLIMPLSQDERDYGKARGAIEWDLTATQSKSVQQIDANDLIKFQNQFYPGPASIEQQLTMYKGSMLFRFRPRLEQLYFDVLAGLAGMQIHLRLESGGVVTEGTSSDLFLPIGLGAGVTMGERLDVHCRALMNALVMTTAASLMNEYEVLLTYWLTKHFAVMGGYRGVRYTTTDLYELREESELNMTWSGYSAGLLWSF